MLAPPPLYESSYWLFNPSAGLRLYIYKHGVVPLKGINYQIMDRDLKAQSQGSDMLTPYKVLDQNRRKNTEDTRVNVVSG